MKKFKSLIASFTFLIIWISPTNLTAEIMCTGGAATGCFVVACCQVPQCFVPAPGVTVTSCGVMAPSDADELLLVQPVEVVQNGDQLYYISETGLIIGSSPVDNNGDKQVNQERNTFYNTIAHWLNEITNYFA